VATGFNRNNGLLMNLGMTMLRPVARSPEKGAETLVWLVTAPHVANVSGVYFFDQEQTPPSSEAQDTDTARRLCRARCAPAAHAAPIPALPHVIEATLNHTIPGVAGVYRRHNFVEEKKAALEALASLLASIVG
jgi:hypothetical protein